MENYFTGKKILFFSPAFFGYEQKIKKKMQDLGAEVDYYDERPFSSSWQKALIKIDPYIFKKKTEGYYKQILEQIKDKNYDYVFFVKCEMPTVEILKLYKECFPNSTFCLYLWDSIQNVKHILSKIKFFDFVSSFDMDDSKKTPEISFRPLFFADEFRKPITNKVKYDFDISFIGTIHSDRYKILKEVTKFAYSNHFKMFQFKFLQSKFIYYFYKITKTEFKNTKINDFDFDKLATNKIANIVDNSKVIIDIQHPKQTGLTMRTIEMIGMNKKLITTNQNIKTYDFYNVNNIHVIDRNNVSIKKSFIESSFQPIPVEIYEKYSLENWLKDVLKEK